MRTATKLLAAVTLLLMLIAPVSAQAAFGFEDLDVTFVNADGSPATQAGSHPYAMTTTLDFDKKLDPNYGLITDEMVRDLTGFQIEGLVGEPTAVPRCSTLDFLTPNEEVINSDNPNCAASSVVGRVGVRVGVPTGNAFGEFLQLNKAIYSLEPPPGVAMKLGFWVQTVPITVELGVNPSPPYNVIATLRNIPQAVLLGGSEFTLWGVPGDSRHDSERGTCLFTLEADKCPVNGFKRPFLTLPRACQGPLETSYYADSWQSSASFLQDGLPDPSDAAWAQASTITHDGADPPFPQGFTGCGRLDLKPSISAQPTAKAAESPTGLDFSLEVSDEGLTSAAEGALAQSDIRKVVATLPEGFTTNPSLAEGLEVCTEADLARETLRSEPGAGCPDASKIGTVEVETPLLEETVKGALFIAKPYENPFGSLLAMYIVIKNPTLGIIIKQPLEVTSDPKTGRLTTVAEDLPQLPYSHFRLHFREGTRSPLATPAACGTYGAKAVLTPWSGNPAVEAASAFEIITGPDSSPCPKGGLPPFRPNLLAGSINNRAGSFSPFNVKITRTDSEQEITHFSIKLPPGVAGKLAGIPFCSDAAIAKATSRTGPHGGQEELDDPSCPAASQVGRTLAGAGVGPSLAYAPGKIYLAGPYHGAPISFVSITSGVVGPFDIGTVVVRLAIAVNPETGEVFLDSTGSDPIPHIVHGIPLHVRDIRAYTDRPQFTFNPTSCERKSTAATVLGSGLDFASEADDNPFVSTSRFQAADCAALPFKPKLSLKLVGGTRRGAFPQLKAFLRMNGFGEAGISRARVTLPRSEFIANAHFDTICTRAQFKLMGGNGEACPAGSIYGWARAKSPILSDPVEGPVFLRSSEHELPDVVASLRGQEINVHLVGHVDSVKGQLRSTFETVPDAPVEWASFSFKGQKKGLFENSTNLCVGTHKAKVEFTGQNGKTANYGSALKVKCPKKHKGAERKRAARGGR